MISQISLFFLAVEQLGERKNLLSDLRVLSGLCVDDLASAEPKGDSQSQDANGKGRYDVPPVSGGKTRNFLAPFFSPKLAAKGHLKHVKHPLPWIRKKRGMENSLCILSVFVTPVCIQKY